MRREFEVLVAVAVTFFAVLGFATFVNVVILDRPEFCQEAKS